MQQSVLVTGGLGYIGSHTVVALHNAGYKVVIVDNLNNSEPWILERVEDLCQPSIPFEKVDVRDFEALSAVFEKYTITGVIHFAAYKAVGESVKEPLKYYDNNVGGLINLLKVMANYQCGHLIFSSSCTVYGQPKQLPVTENSPVVKAESPYGNTKKICEEIIDHHTQPFDLKAINLRYFNPVGAHESAKIGELPLGVPNNLVPFITQTAAGLRKQLTIFGSDYNTPDGTCIRDYIHVVDLAEAHVKALEYSHKMEQSLDVVNLGTGNGYSVSQVVEAFEKVNGVKLNFTFGERREGDVEQIWANAEKAAKVLGWKAQRGVDEMMESAWKWQQNLRPKQ